MNEILYSLYDRRSVRAFEDRPVAEEQKRMVLDAAAQAPSAGCQQLYTILDITDPALKERLAETCDHQSFIARAPVVLIFCADCLKWFDAYVEAGCTPRQPRAGDLLLAVDDALIAAQNAVVAAQSLGLGVLLHRGRHGAVRGAPAPAQAARMGVPGLYAGAGLAHPTAARASQTGAVCTKTHCPRERLSPDGGARAAGDVRRTHRRAVLRGLDERFLQTEIRLGFRPGDEPVGGGIPERF